MVKKRLICGNEALAEAAIQAGCRCYFGYPITPQNEVTTYMSDRMPEVGGQFVQCESELAAISMVLGAAAVGEMVMTSSSSPGISLMQEGISYLVADELPAVIVNIMRGGPGLGNIGPSQADYFQATRGGGHGDYRTIVLAPATVQELVDHVFLAFKLADRYRSPVLIVGDGVLGQMMEPVKIKTLEEVEQPEKEWALTGCRGREPNKIRSLILGENELLEHNLKLQKKFATIAKKEVRYEAIDTEKAEVLIVAYGMPSRVCRAALRKHREEGYRIGLFRPITLWPFPYSELEEVAKDASTILVVEMSSGQLIEDVRLALGGDRRIKLLGKPGGEFIQFSEIEAELAKIIEQNNLKKYRK